MEHSNTSNCHNCQNEDKPKCECYQCLKKHHDLMHNNHQKLVDCLDGLMDGLNSNGDPERCGLSAEQWAKLIKDCEALLKEVSK